MILPKLHHADQLGGQGGTLTFRANDKNHGCSRLRSNFISAGARSTSNAVIKSHGSFDHRKITGNPLCMISVPEIIGYVIC